MNTVIRSPNWIGDGIMCLPAIRAYKEHFPKERLVIVAKRYLADIFLNIPEIDEIVPIPDRWTAATYFACLKKLRAKHFDRGLLFTNSFASALLFRLAGIRSCSGYNRDGRGWLLSDKIPFKKNLDHHQYYYMNLIEHLVGKKISPRVATGLVVAQEESEWAAGWLEEQGIGTRSSFLAIAPAAAYGSAKAWLPERFRQVIVSWQKTNPDCSILLLGGWAEKEKIAAIADGLPGRVINLAGRLTLRQTIVILARCRLFIGNDSGLMHAAAALAVPLVAVFGPTEPGKTAPIGKTYRLLHHGADCTPCLHRECPTDHRCMSAVSSDEVLAAAAQLWKQALPEAK
ncbi:MAG TPA: lipopolysaccharide heptosyltransferase II [Patescibacteria group bacterium]|nr:lipopolysaccharide heptosyltransferase II [Patescibacteria group bacterium]